MSLDVASKDFWSATGSCTIGERCKFMFNNELLSDVEFALLDAEGESKSMKKISAHKFLLAISSPVFYAMFYGELAEKKDSIYISDCDYESLSELFRFMYSDEVNLNADNVMQMLYLAKKYMLPSLADKCTEFLRENVDASNVFHVLPSAQKYEEKDLVDHCWEVIDEQADEAVKSDGFVTIEKSVLETLVERDSLNVKEVELFKAVDCWATNECEKHGQAAAGPEKRRILGERIVKAIRFPVMEQEAFADVVLDCDILTEKELFELTKYFHSVLKFPVGFSEVPRAGSHHNRRIISRFEFLDKCNGAWSYSDHTSDSIVFSVDKNIMLHAVRLFGSEHNEYLVTLELTDSNGAVLATKTGKFLSELVQSEKGKYRGIDIVFKPPVDLKARTQYCFDAFIRGPPSARGQGGSSPVEQAGVTFSFSNSAGARKNQDTTVSTGQFSEFVFTIK